VQVGQRLVIEGRLRINTVTRKDGIKEKRAEFTLSRLHPLVAADATAPAAMAPAAPQGSLANSAYGNAPAPGPGRGSFSPRPEPAAPAPAQAPTWNTSPLVPDLPEGDDDIPF
jgi:single-stranded DNA-binding protein